MYFSDSDDHFDTPLDYTQTIFMEIQHFCICGDTTMHTTSKPQPTCYFFLSYSLTLIFYWSGTH